MVVKFLLAPRRPFSMLPVTIFTDMMNNSLGGLNYVNSLQKLLRNSASCLFSFIVEIANWLTFKVSLMLSFNA